MAHIPDGFLSAPVCAGSLSVAAGLAFYASRRAGVRLEGRAAPTLGLATALMFAAQMINFPVVAGTSGHLLGVTLMAVLLGPWVAYLSATGVVLAQALLFGDGGVSTLGANVLNIAGIGAFLGYGVYRAVLAGGGTGPFARCLGAGLGAYTATLLTGLAAGLELGLSGTVDTRVAMSAMGGVYGLIGWVEAGVTGAAVWALVRRDPRLLYRPRTRNLPTFGRAAVLGGLAVGAAAAGLLAIFASAAPDGLERVALDLGFAEAATRWFTAPFMGYRAGFPGAVGTTAAGLVGVAFLFTGVAALVRAIVRPTARARLERPGPED